MGNVDWIRPKQQQVLLELARKGGFVKRLGLTLNEETISKIAEAEKRRKEEVCVTPAFWGSVLPAGETYSAERVGDLWLRPVPHWQLTRRLSCHYTRIHANTHTHTLRQSSGEC